MPPANVRKPRIIMTHNPRLSIGVPVYNGERFLPALFENLTAQTFRDFEIVVSDNASTDATPLICAEWASRDPRIRYHRNSSNVGACANFNKVFELAQAPLFKWAACDDSYGPTYLEACVRIMDNNPDVVLSQTDVICVDDQGIPFERDAATGHFIIPGTTLRYAIDPIDVGESSSALARFYDVLFRCRSNAQIFGIIRRDALARTGLLPNFLGSEKATVLELALLGRFGQDRSPLFHRCYHPGITEVKAKSEAKTYMSMTETAYSRPVRMFTTFLASPLGKPVGPLTKLGCFALLGLRSVSFLFRSTLQSEAKSWPFRAAWGSAKKNPSGTTSPH